MMKKKMDFMIGMENKMNLKKKILIKRINLMVTPKDLDVQLNPMPLKLTNKRTNQGLEIIIEKMHILKK